jgi:hypothetical protein
VSPPTPLTTHQIYIKLTPNLLTIPFPPRRTRSVSTTARWTSWSSAAGSTATCWRCSPARPRAAAPALRARKGGPSTFLERTQCMSNGRPGRVAACAQLFALPLDAGLLGRLKDSKDRVDHETDMAPVETGRPWPFAATA